MQTFSRYATFNPVQSPTSYPSYGTNGYQNSCAALTLLWKQVPVCTYSRKDHPGLQLQTEDMPFPRG